MNCLVCHHGQTGPGRTTVAFHRDSRTVVINEVPADICENCTEVYVAEDVTKRVLAIAGEARYAGVQLLVRDFTPFG